MNFMCVYAQFYLRKVLGESRKLTLYTIQVHHVCSVTNQSTSVTTFHPISDNTSSKTAQKLVATYSMLISTNKFQVFLKIKSQLYFQYYVFLKSFNCVKQNCSYQVSIFLKNVSLAVLFACWASYLISLIHPEVFSA